MPLTPSTRWRRLGRAATYAVVVALLVATLAALVREPFLPLVRLDARATAAATDVSRAHPGLVDALVLWQKASRPFTSYLLVAFPCCLVAWWPLRLRTRAWWALATMLVGWGLASLLKELVRRPRPVVDDPVSQSPGYSFPSGHAANAAIIATTLVLLLWPVLSVRLRRVAVAGGAVWVVLTCLDRVFLGVHYPSDVTAGVLLGCGLVLASFAGYTGWGPAGDGRRQDSAPASTSRGSRPRKAA